jgi:tyrosyl-tRNA synthetase
MDDDVERYLGLFTFLPLDEVHALGALKPPLLNRAKEILAYEATLINHGKESAFRSFQASVKKFGEADPGGVVDTSSTIVKAAGSEADSPSVKIQRDLLLQGFTVVDAFVAAGLTASKGEARRLIRQGGAYVEERRVEDENQSLTEGDFKESGLDLRAGKKRHMRLVIE